jgi:eukaryotic-like serine/threonine-protein kinase
VLDAEEAGGAVVTSQAPVEKTRSVPDGDALPHPHTESSDAITDGPDRRGPTDPPTVALTLGVDDAAVHGVDEVLGREVRLVTLPPASGDELSERIEQVRHLARLHHPHLLEVYDVDGLAPDTESTLVLENVAGEPLALVLREGPIAEPAVARMGAQVASALAHAHAHGVEHGAIGAASILVDRAHTDAWLVGLTASLSGPLPVIDPEADDDGAARRRASDVRSLAAVLGEILEHTVATTGGDDPAAVTLPTARDDEVPASPLAALLREVDSPEPPSAAAFSDQLARVGRGVAAHEVTEEPTRLVPVVASWSESPATGIPVPPELLVPAALAAGPAARAGGVRGVTPLTVIGPAGRRARRAGVLGAATATLALASGLVIWAGESHPVRPEAQAEIGASAPSSLVPPPLVPRPADAGSPPGGGGGGGTWTAGSSGSEQVAVGVAARKAALREEPSRAAVETSEASAPRSSSTPESNDPVVPPSTTRPRISTPPRTTTPPTTTRPITTRPTTRPRTTPTSTVAPTTTAAPTTTTAKATSSTATSSTSTSSTVTGTTVAPTTTPSAQTVLAAGQ